MSNEHEESATEAKLSPIEAAAKAGRREGLENNQVRVIGGQVLTFKGLTAFDSLMIDEEAKVPAHRLIKENPQKYALLVAWRAAVNGGLEVPFHDFAKLVPSSQIAEVSEITASILGNVVST